MKLGVVVAPADPWRFFTDIYEDFKKRHEVQVFTSRHWNLPIFNARINRRLFQHDLASFLVENDLVFFEWASDLLAEATRLPKSTRIVTRLHRYEMFRWTAHIQWEKVDRVILVSRAMQEKFIRRFPDHAHKTVVIPEAVDTTRFQPVVKAFNRDLGTLCFPTPRKRVYELILAFAELHKQEPGYRLHIGGSSSKFDDYNDALNSLVRKLGLEQQVIFYGDVREPWKWYPNIDIFISNSYSEGLQVAPIEAMASARYTLSHFWDGADELLPPENLFLSETELIAKIQEYAGAGEAEQLRRQEMMRLRACEQFEIESIKRQVGWVIEDLLRRSHPAAGQIQGPFPTVGGPVSPEGGSLAAR